MGGHLLFGWSATHEIDKPPLNGAGGGCITLETPHGSIMRCYEGGATTTNAISGLADHPCHAPVLEYNEKRELEY
jgi:hypothetical protein